MIKKLVGSRLRIGAGAALAFAIIFAIVTSAPRAFSRPPEATTDAALIEGYRHVEVASVSDAMEKLTGQKSAFRCSRWEQFRQHQWGIIVLQAPIFRWCVMVFQ